MADVKHALLSASGAARWLRCPPSARLEEKVAKKSNDAADEGTAAHELCELVTRYWLGEIDEAEYIQLLDKLKASKWYDGEMQECAEDYARFITERVAEAQEYCSDAFVELEVKELDFSKYAPEGHGTSDCIVIADKTLEVIDFKYGKGHPVFAENNPQMRLYALGALERYGELFDISRVRMTIVQPRVRREASVEEIDAAELIGWAEKYVKPRAALAFAGQGDFEPSDEACMFCRVKETCKARADKMLELFDESPDALLLTTQEAGDVLAKAKALGMVAWLKDLENAVKRALFAGEDVDGWKLVEGRSNRKYSDETQVAEKLLENGYTDEQIFEKTLLGITAMEKTFGKKTIGAIIGELIVKPEGKPALAPASDKKPAITPSAAIIAAFDDDCEEDD